MTIDRRGCLRALACCAALLALRAGAQDSTRVWRIGYLDQGAAARNRLYIDALRQGLHDLGWTDGRNIRIEARFAEGRTDRLPKLAAELIEVPVDIMVTWSTPAALAAKHASASIPIVIGFTADPVGSGIVASLAHPGANITGWTHIGLELRAKYLELLKEALPEASRIGVLWNPSNQVHQPSLKVIEEAAQRLDVELVETGVQNPKDLEAAYAKWAEKRTQGIVVFPDGMFVAQMPLIVSLAARYRLPAMYGVREYVAAGGLMAYGANLAQMERKVGAAFVDKILRGAHPGDLPVAQPTKFELLLNGRTARELGITLPASLLVRADEVM